MLVPENSITIHTPVISTNDTAIFGQASKTETMSLKAKIFD